MHVGGLCDRQRARIGAIESSQWRDYPCLLITHTLQASADPRRQQDDDNNNSTRDQDDHVDEALGQISSPDYVDVNIL